MRPGEAKLRAPSGNDGVMLSRGGEEGSFHGEFGIGGEDGPEEGDFRPAGTTRFHGGWLATGGCLPLA